MYNTVKFYQTNALLFWPLFLPFIAWWSSSDSCLDFAIYRLISCLRGYLPFKFKLLEDNYDDYHLNMEGLASQSQK